MTGEEGPVRSMDNGIAPAETYPLVKKNVDAIKKRITANRVLTFRVDFIELRYLNNRILLDLV